MKRLLWLVLVLMPLATFNLVSSPAAPVVAWEKEAWDADEKPFREAEQEVLRLLNTKDEAQMKRVYARLEQQAQAQPNDVMAQFKQAVALARLIMRGLSFPYTSRLREKLSQVSPHSYVFARTRYLIEVGHHNEEDDVIEVGRRLLKRVPNDYHVLFHQTRVLDLRDPKERAESFAHAQRILKLRPNDYKSYNLMGDNYRTLWFIDNLNEKAPQGSRWSGKRGKANRDRAIYYFREAKKRVPAGHWMIEGLDKSIAAMLAGRVI